jgi:DNA-binding SARP family transcriptional activator
MAAKVRMPSLPPTLDRQRLNATLERVWDHRLGLVVAPAGSGKTTLLAKFCRSLSAPTAWYQAESSEATVADLLAHLWAAFTAALGPLPGDWTSVEGAAAALEGWRGDRALLVIDDLHQLERTPAEAALERLCAFLPRGLAMVVASRYPPGFNLTRLRLSGEVLELGPDDLRFRTWEVERLFREHYRQPLRPEELARLAGRTEGWAAGIALFHLSTRDKPAGERQRLLSSLASRSNLVREYLTRNLLDDLPAELRDFLIRTSILGRLTGQLCDQLLDRPGSHRLLAEIERRQITSPALDDGSYRYHDVLRSFLEDLLVEQHGEAAVRRQLQRAGELLEAESALPDALRAYCRAEDREAVTRLLGRCGERAISGTNDWMESVPRSLADHDPWLLLVSARRHVAEGQLHAAIDAYQRAELRFGAESAAKACGQERRAVAGWLDPSYAQATDWSGLVRGATTGQPREMAKKAADQPGPLCELAAGLAALLAGHATEAARHLDAVTQHPAASPVLAAGARLGRLFAGTLTGGDRGSSVQGWTLRVLEQAGMTWLAHLGQVLDDPGAAGLELAGLGGSGEGQEPWVTGVTALAAGLMELWGGGAPVSVLERASAAVRRLRAPVLEAWADGGHALAAARAEAPAALELATRAAQRARATGCDGAELLARVALAEADELRRGEHLGVARLLAEQTGLRLRELVARPERDPVPSTPPAVDSAARLCCFGGFQLTVGGADVDVTTVKPRARSLLRLLAAYAGLPVHRELLMEALWPELDELSAVRSLQVAVSSLRGLLEPGRARGEGSMIRREGDAYRLCLPRAARSDVMTFEQALTGGRAAQSEGRQRDAREAFVVALAAYRGELLPEEGPSEWVVKRREHYRMEAADAAQSLAELELAGSDLARAVAACERGLHIDCYRDGLWRSLLVAYERSGDQAAAARTRQDYREMLSELGLSEPC